MKLKLLLGSLTIVFLTVFSLVCASHHPLNSAPPTSIKDVLSNSQLSYFARLSVGPTIGDSVIKIYTSGTVPSISTNNLFIGDTLGIATTGAGATPGPLTNYVIKDIGNTLNIELSSGIGQSNAFVNAAVIATRSAIHTITFTPQSNYTGGYWQFLIRATNRTGETYNDGIPDQQGFDLGQDVGTQTTGPGTRLKVADVTCPSWGTGVTTAFSIGTTTLTTGGVGATGAYDLITCFLGAGGTNQVGTSYSATIGRALTAGSELINPAPSTGHTTEGLANNAGPDVYTFLIRHLDNGTSLVDADTIQGKIAVIESVRVTATVDPTISFQIGTSGIGSTGPTTCGIGQSAQANYVTADAVPFGSLVLATSNDLAQWLSCITNGSGGYVVTVYETSAFTNVGSTATVADTVCNNSPACTTSTPQTWSTFTNSGWGYAIQNINVGTSVTDWHTGYRPFGSGAASAQSIMSNTSVPSTAETAYACYRLTASTTQAAGNYEDHLVYTATATF